MLKACLDSDVERFVQASSASVYGNAKSLPVDESSCPNPISPFAVSKLASESYAKAFHNTYGLETVCLRYFNVYGPRQVPNFCGVIMACLAKLLQNRRPVIFGNGEQTRDFVHVEDVAEANILALKKKKRWGKYLTSVREVLRR